MNKNPVTRYLRALRQQEGKTQMQIGIFLGHSTAQFVSNYERNLCCPSREMAIRITRELNGSIPALRALFAKIEHDKFERALKLSRKAKK